MYNSYGYNAYSGSRQTNIESDGIYGTAYYYNRQDCVHTSMGGSNTQGCKTDYNESDIKKAIDEWTADKLNEDDLTNDYLGYKVRLLTYSELIDDFHFELQFIKPTVASYAKTSLTLEFVTSSSYNYWTMSKHEDSDTGVYVIQKNGEIRDWPVFGSLSYGGASIRPVITLKKSAINN